MVLWQQLVMEQALRFVGDRAMVLSHIHFNVVPISNSICCGEQRRHLLAVVRSSSALVS